MTYAKPLVAVLCTCLALHAVCAAVKPDENLLLNGALEADQAEFPPFWTKPDGGNIEWLPTDGPEGAACIVFRPAAEKKGRISISQSNLRLVEKARYKISARVRTKGFSAANAGICVINKGRAKSAGIYKFPADTKGDWIKVEREFACFETKRGEYWMAIHVSDIKGEFAVADLHLTAVDALALEQTVLTPAAGMVNEPRLVPFSPLLCKIPRSEPVVEFRFFGNLPAGTRPEDCEARLARDGSREISRTPLAVKTPVMLAVPEAGTATGGTLSVSLALKKDGRELFSDTFRYAVRDVPQGLQKGRRLNNLARELASERHKDGAIDTYRFDMASDGWIFVKAGDGGASVQLDGRDVIGPATPRGETFRNITAGRHAIKVSGPEADVIVRAIADIFNYCPGVNSLVPENTPYNWAFQEKYVLKAVTSQNGGAIPADNLEDFLARGYRWLANLGTTASTADELFRKLEGAAGMTRHGYAGVTCDEQFMYHTDEIIEYTKGLKRFDLERTPSRLVWTWLVGKPTPSVVSAMFFSTCMNASHGEGRVLFESYNRTRATEDEARAAMDGYIKGTIQHYKAVYPISPASTCVALGNFNQIPILSLAHHPEVDYKYYLDMQLNFIANDPEFDGLGAVGYWGSYYADEELHRWSFELMRHYVVEGRTEMLSRKYGLKYRPDFIKNGDFRNTLEPWTVSGNVRIATNKGFGNASENRWSGNGTLGDTCAVLVREGDSAAKISQTAKNLVPGRTYRLRYAAFDAKDAAAKRVAPRKFAITAELGAGAETIPELTWVHVDKRTKSRRGKPYESARINFGQIVFKATAPEVEISFSNTGAKAGEELAVNCVSLLPYLR